ncbi:hypothetical protein GOODEAATRI_003677 [Goodea atripinnis]|uniref:Uncharacterized protein n=1 Tax=Goodea atripinnis TaxID=208336 RepID=A0ABV0N7W1_9TELE
MFSLPGLLCGWLCLVGLWHFMFNGIVLVQQMSKAIDDVLRRAQTERDAAAVGAPQGTQIIKINVYTHIGHGAVRLQLQRPCGSTKCFRKKEVSPDAAEASVSSS